MFFFNPLSYSDEHETPVNESREMYTLMEVFHNFESFVFASLNFIQIF
jgi:hypothetical protein